MMVRFLYAMFAGIAAFLLSGCCYSAKFSTTEEAKEYLDSLFGDQALNFDPRYKNEEFFTRRIWTFNLKGYPDITFKVASTKKFSTANGAYIWLSDNVEHTLLQKQVELFRKTNDSAKCFSPNEQEYRHKFYPTKLNVELVDIARLAETNLLVSDFQKQIDSLCPLLGKITFEVGVDVPKFRKDQHERVTATFNTDELETWQVGFLDRIFEMSAQFYALFNGVSKENMHAWLKQKIAQEQERAKDTTASISRREERERVVAVQYKEIPDLYAVEVVNPDTIPPTWTHQDRGVWLSYGAAGELLKRMGFSLRGDANGFEMEANGNTYQFSYDFVERAHFYYLKNGEKINGVNNSCDQPFGEALFREITGSRLREVVTLFPLSTAEEVVPDASGT